MTTLVADTRHVFQREISLILRDPFSMIFSLVQPLVFLGLFGPLLAGSVNPAAINGASPLQWFLPGVIVMSNPARQSDQLFHFTLLGSPNQILRVDATTNFQAWVPIANVTNVTGTIDVVDPQSTNFPLRFYRAVAP